jgi:RNA polymerase sigma-70 factor (ECF subfamily)
MVANALQLGSSFQDTRTSPGPSGRAVISGQEAVHDAELVRRFKGGDEVAFVEIVTRFRGRMNSIALSHLRNHADAEEITQDTFIRAHRGLARFRGDSSLATWLHRIAFNLSRNRCKYYSYRCRHSTLSLDCSLSDDKRATVSESIASDAPDPVREAMVGEFSALVNVCMDRLSPRQREILALRNGSNESYGDIAQKLGISIGTVKSRLARAREKLRALLAESYSELPPDASPFDWFEPNQPCGRLAVFSA